jgi:hypothetical protein
MRRLYTRIDKTLYKATSGVEKFRSSTISSSEFIIAYDSVEVWNAIVIVLQDSILQCDGSI